MADGNASTVLIIDDDADLRFLMRRIVKRTGLASLEARDGQEGLDLFRRHQGEIACVIVDQYMPVLGGPATLSGLRALRPDLPALLISGDQFAHADEGQAGPPTLLIYKPFSVDELQAALRTLLGLAA